MRQRGVQRGQLLGTGTAVDGRARSDRQLVLRQEHRPRLEDRQIGVAPADVAAQRPEQARQQRGAQPRLLVVERVDQRHRPAAAVVRLQAERVEGGLADERVVVDLDEAGAGQCHAHPAARPLGLGQALARRDGGHPGGDVVVPLQSDDLLREVVRVGEVGAPGRRGDLQDVGAGDRAADLLEAPGDGLAAVPGAGDPVGQVGGDGDGAHRVRGGDVGDTGLGGTAGDQHQQVDGALRGGAGGLRVDAALEALGRLGGQLVPLGTAGDGDRVEVRRLDDHLGGARTGGRVEDLGGGAAHDAGQADRAAVVADQQVLGGQRALDAVEGGQALARLGPADRDRAGHALLVVGVQRLAHLQHHVVGDVDSERDRADARLLQPALEPDRGLGGRVDADHGAGHEAVAAGRVVDLHQVAEGVGRRHVEQCRVGQRQPVRGGGLAGDAAHGQAVAAVRGDGDVEHVVDQLEQLDRVGAGLVLRRQHDDAVVVVAHAQLAGGADHAGRGVAVGLAGGDRERAGQHGAREDHHDLVADGEVGRAADDLLRVAGAVGRTDVDPAVPDRLLEAGQLLDGEHLADHQRALEVAADLLDGLDLQAGPDQALGHVAAGLAGRQVDVLAQPGKRDAHQISIPNGRVKRTSPSTMSRMSATL